MKKKYGKFMISNSGNTNKTVELIETFDTLEEAVYSLGESNSIQNCFIMEIITHEFFNH